MRRKEKGKEKGKQKGKRQNEQQTNGAEMGFIDLGGGHHSWGVPFVSFQNHHVFFLICLYHFRHFGLIRRNWRNEQRSGIRGAANMNYIL